MFVVTSEMGYAKVLCDTLDEAIMTSVPEWGEHVVETPEGIIVDQDVSEWIVE